MTDRSQEPRKLRQLPSAFELQPGFHVTPAEGLCALEAVSWIAGLDHTDEPDCVCPTLISLMRCINDHMPHFQRQRLVPLLPRLVDTDKDGRGLRRAEELAWRALTLAAPVPLAARGLLDETGTLECLPRHDRAATKAEFEHIKETVHKLAWEEAKANGARYWHANVKVRPETWASYEAVRLGQEIVDILAAECEDAETLAMPAARMIGAVGRFDAKAWTLALDAVKALLQVTETETVVVRLDDFRKGGIRAA